MATTLYFRGDGSGGEAYYATAHFATNLAKLDGTSSAWKVPQALTTTAGSSPNARATPTVTGPTNGVEVQVSGSQPYQWLSEPLDAAVTISGTITLNIWAHENDMMANVAINAIIERIDSQGNVASTIAQSANTTELGTASSANNFTVSPTSTAMAKGDRIRVRIYGDDGGGSMASTYTFTVTVGGATGGADGDSYVTFTETLGFLTSAPAGSVLYLTDAAGPAVGSQVEKDMWTSRGDGVNSIVVNTAAGWTAPIQWTDSAGGTVVEWYSRQLQALTLAGLVKCNLRASTTATFLGVRAELAVCNSDGSGASVWGATNWVDGGTSVDDRLNSTAEAVCAVTLAGADTSVTDGQRLRLRLYIDDVSSGAILSGNTGTLYYDGTSGGASGDSYITLPQTISEYTSAYAKTGYGREGL